MRRQYHFRRVGSDMHIWDVMKLQSLAVELPVQTIPLDRIEELDEAYWAGDGLPLTCREVVEHARLIADADCSYPILLDPSGRVLDGMHRVCKAQLQNATSVTAKILPTLPPPDYINVDESDLDYG